MGPILWVYGLWIGHWRNFVTGLQTVSVHVKKSYLASRIKRFLKNPDKLEKLILTFCDQRRSSTYTGYITFVNILSNIVKGTAETIDNISWYPGMLYTV